MLKSFDTDGIPHTEVSVFSDSSILDAFALFSRYHLKTLPVINREGNIVGFLTQESFIEALSELCGAEAPGSLIALELNAVDYSLSEISRIVESNRAHILSLFTHFQPGTEKLQMLLKIDLEDASPVIRSFERFNYTVSYYCMKQGVIDESLQRRVDELLFYMNI